MDNLQARLQEHLGSAYVLQFELGGAGMSRVFVAEEVALRRKVVIKVLSPSLAATVSGERFEREIMVVAKLNHPNIVPVLSANDFDGLPYFIMPYIEGESLRGRILRGPLSLRETITVLKDVMRALSYAHSVGIVHRDMKPDNILLAASAAVVTDFGVAKAVSAARRRGETQPGQAGQAITGVGISLGTPQYMAPEQAAADPDADHKVDLYSMGIVAYEMLVGSPPFHGRTPQALLAAQLTELPPPLASRRYEVPVALADIIMQCLEKDPADRPRSATEVMRVLDSPEALSGPTAATPQARARERKRKWITAASALFAVAALAGAFAWALWPEPAVTATQAAAPGRTIRMVPAASIGPEGEALAAAMSTAIEAALVREGMRVLRGPLSASTPASATDSAQLIIETTLQRVGPRARVQVRVTSPDPNVPVWADQLDFPISESFAAQDSLAARVLRAVTRASARPR